jgi:hypothetical protein
MTIKTHFFFLQMVIKQFKICIVYLFDICLFQSSLYVLLHVLLLYVLPFQLHLITPVKLGKQYRL